MEKEQAAALCVFMIGGVGALLAVIGILLAFRQKRKIRNCTSYTTGWVVRHCFPGGGRMYPMVEYQVGGKIYQVSRKFRGLISKSKVTPKKLYEETGAYVTANDYLFVPVSAITNLKAMAQQLWPIKSQMAVYYNPLCPKQAYAERIPTKKPMEAIVFFWAGIGLFAVSFFIAFLISR